MKYSFGHFSIIFNFSTFVQIAVIIALSVFMPSLGIGVSGREFALFAFIFFGTLLKLVSFGFTKYRYDDNIIYLKKGIIFKKQSLIPINKITTVRLSQNLVQRVFRRYNFQANNASSGMYTSRASEVKIALSKKEIDKIISKIPNIDYKIKREISYKRKASSFRILAFDTLKSQIVVAMIFIPLLYSILSLTLSTILEQVYLSTFLQSIISSFNSGYNLFLAVVSLYLITFVIKVFQTTLNYFRFSFEYADGVIDIVYGSFERKRFIMSVPDISNVCVHQNILMRLFLVKTINIYNFGYGNFQDKKARRTPIVFPAMSQKLVSEILEKLQVPVFSGKVTGRYKKATPYIYLNMYSIILYLSTLLALIISNYYLISFCLLAIAVNMVISLVKFNFSSLDLLEDKLYIRSFGLTFDKFIINKNKIEATKIVTSAFKKLRNVASCKYFVFAPKKGGKVTAFNQSYSRIITINKELR